MAIISLSLFPLLILITPDYYPIQGLCVWGDRATACCMEKWNRAMICVWWRLPFHRCVSFSLFACAWC